MLRIVAILVMCMIVVSLGMALISLVRDKQGSSVRTVRALTIRVVLSLLLFFLIVVAAIFDFFPR